MVHAGYQTADPSTTTEYPKTILSAHQPSSATTYISSLNTNHSLNHPRTQIGTYYTHFYSFPTALTNHHLPASYLPSLLLTWLLSPSTSLHMYCPQASPIFLSMLCYSPHPQPKLLYPLMSRNIPTAIITVHLAPWLFPLYFPTGMFQEPTLQQDTYICTLNLLTGTKPQLLNSTSATSNYKVLGNPATTRAHIKSTGDSAT